MKNGILKEQDYQEQMEHVVEPYLHSKERELWLEREHGKQIYVRCYQAKKARGVVLISHGFTETSEKYKELIYYFLRGGYHVYIPEHCGHGRSYRLVEDPSLVHVDSYKRYVADLLFVARTAKKEHKNLKLISVRAFYGRRYCSSRSGSEAEIIRKTGPVFAYDTSFERESTVA